MGMYDEIKCEYPLPDEDLQNEGFQTKDLENFMEQYTITKDGFLVLHKKTYEFVPEEERPYYGTKDWENNPIVRVFGSFKSTHTCDEHVEYDGDLMFYTIRLNTDEFVDYVATFDKGKLIKLERRK